MSSSKVVDEHEIAPGAVHQREQQLAIGRQRQAVPPRLSQVDDGRPRARRELEKINRCFVSGIADRQEIEAAVTDNEIERVTQSLGDTFLFAPLGWDSPDRTR